jgi:hypothetical protein
MRTRQNTQNRQNTPFALFVRGGGGEGWGGV